MLSPNHAQSSQDSGTIHKSVESVGSRRNHAAREIFGKALEYNTVEDKVGFGRKANRQMKNARKSSQTQNESNEHSVTSSISEDLPKPITIDDDEDVMKVRSSATGYQGTANLRPSKAGPQNPRSRFMPLKPANDTDDIVDELATETESKFFSRGGTSGGNKTMAPPARRAKRHSGGSLTLRDTSPLYLHGDDDSLDELAVSHTTTETVEKYGMVSGYVPKSLSRTGDIPDSGFAKSLSIKTRGKKVSGQGANEAYPVVIFQAGSYLWEHGGDAMEFRLNKDNNFEPFDDNGSLATGLSGLVLKPLGIHRILCHTESPIIQIQRDRGNDPGFAPKVHLKMTSPSVSFRFIQRLQKLNSEIEATHVQ
jgi:hypothetical protein